MSTRAMKRMVTAALAAATVASAFGATAASAGTSNPQTVPPPPSSIAAPAGEAYADLRAPEETAVQPAAVDSGGFDLLSAVIGAAAGAGVVFVLLAAGGMVRRRPLADGHGTVSA